MGDQKPVKKTSTSVWVGTSSYSIYGSQVDLEASYPGSTSYVERGTGLKAELAFKQLLGSAIFLQEGIAYIEKKATHKNTGFVGPARADLTYLQLPLMLGIQTQQKKVTVGFNSGAAVNIELSSGKTTDGSHWMNDSFEQHSLLPSFLLGGFIEVALQKQLALGLAFRYDKDLSPLVERSLLGKHYDINVQGYSVTLGVRW